MVKGRIAALAFTAIVVAVLYKSSPKRTTGRHYQKKDDLRFLPVWIIVNTSNTLVKKKYLLMSEIEQESSEGGKSNVK